MPDLSPEELKRIEDALYRAVLKRVLRDVAIGVGALIAVVVLVAWLSWSVLQRRLVTDAVTLVQSDTTLRSGLLSGLDLDSATFGRLLDSLEALAVDRAGASGGATNDADLRRMLDQLVGGADPSAPGARKRVAPNPLH